MTLGEGRTKVLKLKKSLYGLKSAGKTWFDHLKSGLTKRGFKASEVDPCVYYNETSVVLVYVDYILIVSRRKRNIDAFIESLRNGPEHYDLTDKGDISKYLGVDILKNKDGTFESKQPFLIRRILDKVGLVETTGSKETPVGKPLLYKDCNGHERKMDWHY